MDLFSKACKNFGLTISIAKTEVLHQPAPGSTYTAPSIKCDGQTLPAVDKFTYLGSTLSRSANLDDEVTSCDSQPAYPKQALHLADYGIKLGIEGVSQPRQKSMCTRL